ncbi:MAG TPA: metalloregulator ArsR/SmtB family transcription factor [Parvularculaceae bacterium]|nr:metalloregulator ArsR/SmtB family transcription factor [Parvularculaceae bacterium]HNS88293.1 metalloregulator ArsR/SmtB family transcription factor [Parvularculaceae bacterium]
MTAPLNIDELRERAGEVAGLLKLLSHPNRLLIACELSGGERSVSALESAIDAAQPNLSRDLARMRAEGLVIARRESKSVFYRLADDRLARVLDALCAAFGPEASKPKRRTRK